MIDNDCKYLDSNEFCIIHDDEGEWWEWVYTCTSKKNPYITCEYEDEKDCPYAKD